MEGDVSLFYDDNKFTRKRLTAMPTPRYRAIGDGVSVDESLFGSSQASSTSRTRRIVTGPIGPSDAVLSESELMRITQQSVIKTEAQLQADREYALEVKAAKERKAGERKARMRELEKKALASAKKSDSEVADMERAATLRALAQEKIDKNSDVVKMLNSMSARAIAFTVRDKQLHEKEDRERVDAEIDRRLDILMEIDRLKDLDRREADEAAKIVKRRDDRKVITEQIQVRERQRLLQLEAREQESQQMRALMAKHLEEDQRNAEIRQKEVEKSRTEVALANAASIQAKQAAREAAKKEMEDILIYQALKDAELAKREAEEAEIERQKKERQAKLLAQQERAQNNAGKLDELRARRAAEERERRERQAAREKAAKQKADIQDLLASRAKQAADKVALREREKVYEEDEIRNSLRYMQQMSEREAAEIKSKHDKSMDHRERLFSQIEENERRRRNAQSGNLDDGDKFRQEMVREETKLKVIRDQMVTDLKAKGVNPRYLSEMINVDVGKMLRR